MADEGGKSPEIDAYIAAQADFARPILHHFRGIVRATCPDMTEAIKWGFPHFVHRGKNVASMAAFKGHAAIGFWYAEQDRSAQEGMGHLGKLKAMADLPPDDALHAMVARSMAMIEAGAKPPWMERRAPRAPLPLHPALADAIAACPAASATWAAFPPGKVRDYCEWINDARTDVTRDRRIAQAVTWIAQGKGRNWQYGKG